MIKPGSKLRAFQTKKNLQKVKAENTRGENPRDWAKKTNDCVE